MPQHPKVLYVRQNFQFFYPLQILLCALHPEREQFGTRASNLGYGHPSTCSVLKLTTDLLMELEREDEVSFTN